MNPYRYFIHLAYDGTNFHGWQIQPNATTVQETLEDALTLVLREKITLTGAGRTDAGVHAKSFYAHFDITTLLNETDRKKLVYQLNSFTNPGLAVFEIFPVKPSAHARFSAISRTYTYHIATVKDPFRLLYQYYLHLPIDLNLMNEGAALIMQYHDFTSFSKVNTDTRTNNCKIFHAFWEEKENERVFTIRADRFLRNMVRAIVGTLIDLGLQKISLQELRWIIESRNRSHAGKSVPGCGLLLEKVEYPSEIRLN
ncbi:MAG: tRNA pseudouridine(38-40) synthase TruA [Bacteroidales bacterium]|nr:tRNA pseudouridine(38-40) synthase TruA [Bacteroidales bacterium]